MHPRGLLFAVLRVATPLSTHDLSVTHPLWGKRAEGMLYSTDGFLQARKARVSPWSHHVEDHIGEDLEHCFIPFGLKRPFVHPPKAQLLWAVLALSPGRDSGPLAYSRAQCCLLSVQPRELRTRASAQYWQKLCPAGKKLKGDMAGQVGLG